MKGKPEATVMDTMRALAASYVPEWNFSEQDPDVGSVAAMLVGEMLADSARRLDGVLYKHRIQYLNLFDRYKEEPIECARTYVRFDTVPGLTEPAFVPKGTQVLAEGGDSQITFETAFGIAATAARVEAIYAVDGERDRIVRQFAADGETTVEDCRFTAFDMSGDNLAHHVLHLGFRGVFDHLSALDLRLVPQSPDTDGQKRLIEGLTLPGVRFALAAEGEEDGTYRYRYFDQVERQEDWIRLVMREVEPRTVSMGGEELYVIAVLSDRPDPLELSGVGLWFAESDVPADEVVCRGIPQNARHFHPFGLPLEIYAECSLESAVLERRGAQARLSFRLSYEIIDQLLPEYELDTEYKVIMKKPPTRAKPKRNEVRCDYVLLEYLGRGGWKRILQSEDEAQLFDGRREGLVEIRFTVPDDILSTEAARGPRLRLRLQRADNLYKLPCRQHCPVIDDLHFSYSYEQMPRGADAAVVYNNFTRTNVLPQLNKARPVRLFASVEHPGVAEYFGFSDNPRSTPLSVFFQITNTADLPVDFSAEYYTPRGFEPLKLIDLTAGMVYSEAMLLLVPDDIAPCQLFGRSQYWIRLICHSGRSPADSLPCVEGIYLNMAKAENVDTRTEDFYLDDSDGITRISLAEKGLISARVHVNEATSGGGPGTENWVPWQKAASWEQHGRVYDIDMTTGEILFPKGAFSTYPVQENAPAIRVEYQSYLGSSANVAAGSLHTLANTVRHITGVTNPFPAYGGYDGYNEDTGAAIISNMLRTRGRAVSRQDYFDMISQVSYSVRRIRVESGLDREGRRRPDTITIALLIEEYQQGGHIFSAVKDTVRSKLLSSTNIQTMGKTLMLRQPHFVRISVRLWVECAQMENAYDIQAACGASIRAFLDPLDGGFDHKGWEIGVLPAKSQLRAYLKIHHQDAVVVRMVMTAQVNGREFEVGDDLDRQINNLFAMAVNGTHIVYVQLAQRGAHPPDLPAMHSTEVPHAESPHS